MDNSHFEDKGLEEQQFHEYACPECGFKKLVAEEYDRPSGVSYPTVYHDAICEVCSADMDRK